MVFAYIGLGSNLEEPLIQVRQAFEELKAVAKTRLVARSALYQSRAIGPEQPDYINAVALVEIGLAPPEFLDALQAIEQAQIGSASCKDRVYGTADKDGAAD
jgi:2-amino-4-hydroxy-6-hydroxymethyldihydropteridine diphosphokinase